jgi:hypothetical protein
MPVCSHKEQFQHHLVMWFREQTIENWYSALDEQSGQFPGLGPTPLTCRRFSKSRAANFFISDELVENLRMVSLPKEGISLYLVAVEFSRTVASRRKWILPTVQLYQQIRIGSFKDTEQVGEEGPPFAQFKIVHKVNDEHVEEIEAKPG